MNFSTSIILLCINLVSYLLYGMSLSNNNIHNNRLSKIFNIKNYHQFIIPIITIPIIMTSYVHTVHSYDNLGRSNYNNNNKDILAKSYNLNTEQIKTIISDDINIRQALITADFTRSIYNEKCKFKDEIDTYTMNQYIQGTKALFIPEKSNVKLISPVLYDNNKHEFNFKFSEVLTFNIIFQPRVTLSGRVELTQGDDGLIINSREYWDQSVVDVLKTAKF